ncbi:MAG: alcohol dehydrogenase catalytic domain-containing protein, partial [Chloroflexota bacterium]
MPAQDIYAIGTRPPVGEVPSMMHAQVVRAERFGRPAGAFQVEQVRVPSLKPNEVLLCVMAAGINYNNVWAALGQPLNVIDLHKKDDPSEDFHIGGSDASGIVYAVGGEVRNVRVGDAVVVHAGYWDANDPHIKAGGDPALSASMKVWGYETNWGSFAQFCKVQDHQCLPKPANLTWEQAAAYMLVGATAYRMLNGWPEHTVRPNDVVLIWGAAGGLGSLAIQITKHLGGIPVAVVSSDERGEYCKQLGARGYINRTQFTHWGLPPDFDDAAAYGQWFQGVRGFGRA